MQRTQLTNSPSKTMAARQALGLLKGRALAGEDLDDESFNSILLCLSEPSLLDAVVDDFVGCLRAIVRCQGQLVILKLFSRLADFIQRCNNAKGMVQSFQVMFEELHSRISSPQDEESATLILNSVIAKMLDSLRPETVVIVLTLLTSLQRFATIPSLSHRLQAMFHVKDYFCTEILGSGQFSDVYKGFHKVSGRLVAVKKMKYLNVGEAVQRALTREVQVMKNMNSESVIKLYDHFQLDAYLYIVMEYSPMGDLEGYIRKKGCTDVETVSQMMTEIALGLRFLRSKSIVHRDLKPANILLFPHPDSSQRLRLKLCDFTMARELVSGEMAKTLCGSPLYMAPEVLNRQRYTDKADLWSVGVIMYRLLFNKLPYTGLNEWDLRENINKKDVELLETLPSQPARDLIQMLLQKDPLLRISWEEYFNHDFLQRDLLAAASPLSPRASIELDRSAATQISELQHKLKDYYEKYQKAAMRISTLEKELDESRQREMSIRNRFDEERRAWEIRVHEAEKTISELRDRLHKSAMDLSLSSAMEEVDPTAEALQVEISRFREQAKRLYGSTRDLNGSEGLRDSRGSLSGSNPDQDGMVVEDLLSSLMDKSLQLDNERKKFNVEKYTMVSELQQYRQLFEATAEENTKLNARLRDLTSMEGIFREELREKEERLKAAQEQASAMERFYSEQYSEQVLQLQNEVQHARAEVQFYEEQFKQMEAYRMQLAQYQQQLHQAQQQGFFPVRSPNNPVQAPGRVGSPQGLGAPPGQNR